MLTLRDHVELAERLGYESVTLHTRDVRAVLRELQVHQLDPVALELGRQRIEDVLRAGREMATLLEELRLVSHADVDEVLLPWARACGRLARETLT